MAQILTQVENILKDKYLPALNNQIGIDPSPFLEKMRKVPLTNHIIKAAAPYGLNGGFGFGAEGMGTPVSGGQNYIDFEVPSVDMYVDVEISNKTIELANSNPQAMIRVLDQEVRSSYETAKWNMGRSLFGDKNGVIANFTKITGTTLTLDDAGKIKEGLRIDIYNDGSEVGSEPIAKARRVLSVNRATREVIVEGATITATTGFITVQNSYGRELNGLGTIFNDTILEYGGKRKADFPFMNPVTVDADNDITDLVIYDAVNKAKKDKGAKIDMMLCGDEAFKAYQEYMKINNTVIVENQNFKGGAVGYTVLVGSQKVTVVNESFVPSTEMWGVAMDDWEFHKTDLGFVSHESSVFTLLPGTSIYRALLASYGNVICKNPGGCVRITKANAN